MSDFEQLLKKAKTRLNRAEYNGDDTRCFQGVTISMEGKNVCSLPNHCWAPEDMTAARDLGDIHRASFEAGVRAVYLTLKAEGKL